MLVSLALVTLALPACDGGGDGGKGGSGGENTGGDGGGGGEPEPPHALGAITLGESHASKGGEVFPLVYAVFLPNTEGAAGASCATDVSGCKVSVPPDCGGCKADEYCAFNDACAPTCQKFCSAQCAPDEECYFPSPESPACRKKESFDAGSLAFDGTTVPITLFPPYSYMGMGSGAPFLEGAALTVQASGASGAGFDAFEATFTATRFIQTTPALADIGLGTVLGAGDIPVSWVPGEDDILITATVTTANGSGGTVTCKASDAAGSFMFPRAAITAAAGGSGLSGVQLSIARERTEVKKDLATKGTLTTTKVEEVGWLNLSTLSSESASFSCQFGEVICGDACTDVQNDANNCGDCGKKCVGADFCDSSTCVGDNACNSCFSDSQMAGGACKDELDTCLADTECKALLQCIGGCSTQACADMCFNMHPDGIDLQQAIVSCACFDACSLECSQSC